MASALGLRNHRSPPGSPAGLPVIVDEVGPRGVAPPASTGFAFVKSSCSRWIYRPERPPGLGISQDSAKFRTSRETARGPPSRAGLKRLRLTRGYFRSLMMLNIGM